MTNSVHFLYKCSKDNSFHFLYTQFNPLDFPYKLLSKDNWIPFTRFTKSQNKLNSIFQHRVHPIPSPFSRERLHLAQE